ncbi:hypothetical protein FEM48_Zijuj12G0035900 [Ziziphus jujuba var. spinosa]|uniref:Uncharacterized protein n=1 Tax=Ziziphus jujuba var. spinosa TaxID=714518 RepID=A0A978UAY6_ZIZJJ|nr:hypothetical protein FEM48_Zijuj12G0035900 [Ziziphus jujuba var. spinosa]
MRRRSKQYSGRLMLPLIELVKIFCGLRMLRGSKYMVHLKKKQINRSERYGKDEELNKEGAKEHKKKEAIENRADKVQKEAALGGKSLEKDIVKVKHAPKSQQQGKMISSKAKTPDSESNITKHQIF